MINKKSDLKVGFFCTSFGLISDKILLLSDKMDFQIGNIF